MFLILIWDCKTKKHDFIVIIKSFILNVQFPRHCLGNSFVFTGVNNKWDLNGGGTPKTNMSDIV